MMGRNKEVEIPLYDAFVYLLDTGGEDEVFETIDSIKNDTGTHEDIYRLAKRYYVQNRPLSIKLLNTIIHNKKYFNGFRAYSCCIDQDEKGIDDMVNYLRVTYLAGQLSKKEYIENLDEIVFSIKEFYPSKSKELLKEIYSRSINHD